MADQYVIFYLVPGMQPPDDLLPTGIPLSDGGIVWKGIDTDTFPINDPKAGENYVSHGSHAASQEEIDEYAQILIDIANEEE